VQGNTSILNVISNKTNNNTTLADLLFEDENYSEEADLDF